MKLLKTGYGHFVAIALVTGLCAFSFAGVVVAAEEGKAKETAAPDPAKPTADDVAAVVNDEFIAWSEYQNALRKAGRDRFYHGQAPEDEVEVLKAEVMRDLILRRLMLKEAARRNIMVDEAVVDQRLEAAAKQLAEGPQSEAQQERMLQLMRRQMVNNLTLEALEKDVKAVPEPTAKEARDFYDGNNDLFTEPARQKVSAILLQVDPSASKDVWEKAKDEAQRIRDRVEGGADFAEMARLRSSDGSAAQGGDMGYIHEGMLAPEAEAEVNKLQPGQMTPPVRVLQGYALFKLDDRTEAKLVPFADMEQRAKGLILRNRSEAAWEDLKAKLWAAATIKVDPRINMTLLEGANAKGDAKGG